MKTKTQRTVILENLEQSERFISELENKYLPAVANLSNTLKGMGVEPTKDLIYATITGNFEPIETAYREVLKADAEMFKSPAGKASIDAMFNDNIRNLRGLVDEIFSSVVGNNYVEGNLPNFEDLLKCRDKWGTVPMNSLSLSPFIELNEAGEPFISDDAKESIIDSFRVYASESQEKIYQSQIQAAKALNKFASTLQTEGVFIDLGSILSNGTFISRFFRTSKGEDGMFTINENIEGIR